ncbi:MAG: hypothetical protein S0880_21925 [Actinomycetota bacterium]|nr:hypothetical protein [Actinomycetota bacterium]
MSANAETETGRSPWERVTYDGPPHRRGLKATVRKVAMVGLAVLIGGVLLSRCGDRPVPWSQAELSTGGRTIEIAIGARIGAGPCETQFAYGLSETPQSVTIRIERVSGPHGGDCDAFAQETYLRFTLQQPLGDRPLYNGDSSEPVTVDPMSIVRGD